MTGAAAGAPDPVTLAFTGMLPAATLAALVLGLAASLALLRLYRAAVLRGMRRSRAAAAPPPEGEARAAPSAQLSIARPADARPAGDARRPAWRAAGVYAWAGAAFATVMTAAWLASTADPYIPPIKLAVLFWTYAWPAVLAALLVAAAGARDRWLLVAVYFVPLTALFAVSIARNPELDWLELAQFWLSVDGVPTLLLAAFLARRVRAVGPLVFAFMLTAVIGSQLAVSFVGASESRLAAVATSLFALGLSGAQVFYGLMAAGFLAFAALGWLLLRALAARYRARRLSDESLTVDAVFLLFGMVHSIGLVFEHWSWIFSGLVAFAVFKAAARVGFAGLSRGAARAPRTLLLLRVFALGRRAEGLFDALRRRWLRLGPIVMIAGPDLVESAIEPDEFLAFVSGGLPRAFVADEPDLEARIAALPRTPDPDGRYRVSEFFCQADTWQATMRRLVGLSDAVLMDLRGFSSANQGCLYEIRQLLGLIALERVVLVTDATTDTPFLEDSLQRLWRSLPPDSPNLRAGAPSLRVLSLHGRRARDIDALIALLQDVPRRGRA